MLNVLSLSCFLRSSPEVIYLSQGIVIRRHMMNVCPIKNVGHTSPLVILLRRGLSNFSTEEITCAPKKLISNLWGYSLRPYKYLAFHKLFINTFLVASNSYLTMLVLLYLFYSKKVLYNFFYAFVFSLNYFHELI